MRRGGWAVTERMREELVAEAHRAEAVATRGRGGATERQAEYLLLLSLAELSK